MAVIIELGGGLALLAGFKARWAALAFAIFRVVITPIFHNFWDNPAAQATWRSFGGMLMVMAFGPGRYAVDKEAPAPTRSLTARFSRA